MSAAALTVCVEISENGADDLRLDGLARSLLTELAGGDLAVERPAEAGPHGAKSGVSKTLATLVVTCSSSPVIAQMLGVLRDWLRRREDRRITLTVNRSTFELSSTSASQEYIVVREWLEAQRPLDQ
jgi:membrane-associated two-gene conflict system component 1 (EACC1)